MWYWKLEYPHSGRAWPDDDVAVPDDIAPNRTFWICESGAMRSIDIDQQNLAAFVVRTLGAPASAKSQLLRTLLDHPRKYEYEVTSSIDSGFDRDFVQQYLSTRIVGHALATGSADSGSMVIREACSQMKFQGFGQALQDAIESDEDTPDFPNWGVAKHPIMVRQNIIDENRLISFVDLMGEILRSLQSHNNEDAQGINFAHMLLWFPDLCWSETFTEEINNVFSNGPDCNGKDLLSASLREAEPSTLAEGSQQLYAASTIVDSLLGYNENAALSIVLPKLDLVAKMLHVGWDGLTRENVINYAAVVLIAAARKWINDDVPMSPNAQDLLNQLRGQGGEQRSREICRVILEAFSVSDDFWRLVHEGHSPPVNIGSSGPYKCLQLNSVVDMSWLTSPRRKVQDRDIVTFVIGAALLGYAGVDELSTSALVARFGPRFFLTTATARYDWTDHTGLLKSLHMARGVNSAGIGHLHHAIFGPRG